MTRAFSILLVLAFAACGDAHGQSVTSQRGDSTGAFFPLDVGDAWTYITVLRPRDAPADTVWDRSSAVKEIVVVNDTTYFVTDYPASFANILRQDKQGNIWTRHHDQDVLLFDFSMPDSVSYTFIRNGTDTLVVSSRHGLTVTVSAGVFENCVELHFESQSLDAGALFTFAPGVGVVSSYDGQGWYVELHEATISGVTISDTESVVNAAAHRFDMTAYPNPFDNTAWIVAGSTSARSGEVRVFDVIGRFVRLAEVEDCDERSCRFRVDGSGLPPGVYFARLQSGSTVRTVPVIRR